jgi:hypothetical protein
MTTVLFIFIVIYAISFRANYLWFQRAFSKSDDPHKEGRWSYSDADTASVFFTVFPLVNSIVALSNVLDSPYQDPVSNNTNQFFKVKK